MDHTCFYSRKAELALDTMIQFIIVLVVVGVVVSLVYTSIPSEPPEEGSQSLTEIRNDCQNLCISFQNANTEAQRYERAVDYCLERFVNDFTGDGQVDNLVENDYLSHCEDGVRCFHYHQCESEGVVLDAQTCRDKMCSLYQETEGLDRSEAEDLIENLDFFMEGAEGNRGRGSCEIGETVEIGEVEMSTWLEHFLEDGESSVECGILD